MRALRDFLLEPAPGPARTASHAPPAVPSAGDAASAGPAEWEAPRAAAMSAAVRDRAAAAAARAAALPPGVALLSSPAHARALGAAVALLLARRARARTGLVVVWAEPHGVRPAAAAVWTGPAARRLASALAGRGLDAHASGMLAVAVMPADPVHAAAAAARAIAAAGAAPSVLVLGRRDEAFDALLGDQDRVLVAVSPGVDGALHRLAVAGLASVAGDVRACRVEPSSVARAVAGSGLWVPARVRRPLREALRGLEP